MTPPTPDSASRRPRLRLPFDGRKGDAGEWAFDHRAGLCITLIVYLVLAICFVFSKIVVGDRSHMQGFYIDLQELETLAEQKARLEAEVRARQQASADWSDLRNEVSNEAGHIDPTLRDDRGTNVEAINAAADAVSERMRANREAYEQGLAEEQAIRDAKLREASGSEALTTRKQGNVMVSYLLTDPARQVRHLEVPGYRCESGGEVTVEITVNRAGEVIRTRVIRHGSEERMDRVAEEAAANTLFDINDSAPVRQVGTITYLFRPQ